MMDLSLKIYPRNPAIAFLIESFLKELISEKNQHVLGIWFF